MFQKFKECAERQRKTIMQVSTQSKNVNHCPVGRHTCYGSKVRQAITHWYDSSINRSRGIRKYVPVMVKLCYAIAGVVAIIGAISVYIAMNNEEQDVRRRLWW